jgi:hypothetical protein
MPCPLCKRELGNDFNKHHLIPKTFKGTEIIEIHRICHRKIHSVFTERELLNTYHTIEALLSHEEIQKFVKWVEKKDPDFYDGSVDHKRKKQR